MDEMPVTGLVMTYGYDNLVPDSAQTASHWSTGNKPLTGALSAFPDGTDCQWRTSFNAAQLPFLRDNPRVESLLEFLKRRHGYRTGNVSTAFLTDATPAAQGSHTPTRGATFEVSRQYLENPMLKGSPAFDIILGGGKEDFDADIRADGRDLVKEFTAKGFSFVQTATALTAVPANTKLLLGLFRRPNEVRTAARRDGAHDFSRTHEERERPPPPDARGEGTRPLSSLLCRNRVGTPRRKPSGIDI